MEVMSNLTFNAHSMMQQPTPRLFFFFTSRVISGRKTEARNKTPTPIRSLHLGVSEGRDYCQLAGNCVRSRTSDNLRFAVCCTIPNTEVGHKFPGHKISQGWAEPLHRLRAFFVRLCFLLLFSFCWGLKSCTILTSLFLLLFSL